MKTYKEGVSHGTIFGFIICLFLYVMSTIDMSKKIDKIYNSAVDNKVGEFKIINPHNGDTQFFWITNR